MIAGAVDSPVQKSSKRRTIRCGFTITECTIALAALAACSVIVAETATQTLMMRTKLEGRSEAEQVCANILEQARATDWDELSPEWGSRFKLSQDFAMHWPGARLKVAVELEPDRPRVKRVTARVFWEGNAAAQWPAASLTAVFASRTTGGGK
jgi:hypothetical protein